MAVELWVVNVLKIIIILLAAHLAITRIIPLLSAFLQNVTKDEKSINSFISLLDIFILALVGAKVIEYCLAIGNNILNYIGVLAPAFELVIDVFKYLQWILVILLAVVALKKYKS